MHSRVTRNVPVRFTPMSRFHSFEGDLVAVRRHPQDPGHVAQHVEPPELGHHLRHHGDDCGLVADVAHPGACRRAGGPGRGGGLLDGIALHVDAGHRGPLRGQPIHGGPPDPRGGSGHQDDLVVETFHVLSPM
jgi:hypothetical protein